MKIITTQTKKVFSPEFGWLEQIKTFIFGFLFWTENNPIQLFEPEEQKYSYDLEEMTGYQEWRQKMHLMRLDDETFTQILNTRF